MKNLTSEMIEKAKGAKSAEELLELAKANGVEMTEDEAKTYFAQLSPKCGELDDDELDEVSGGGCNGSDTEELAPAKPKLSLGRTVILKEPGHTFGSCYCQNSVCGCNAFVIVKQINDDKYLLQCNGCDWTYHAVKDNITVIS